MFLRDGTQSLTKTFLGHKADKKLIYSSKGFEHTSMTGQISRANFLKEMLYRK
jgi:hypothetical protein